MIAGFENAVTTMQVGETKRVRIEAKDAYGEEYVQKTITQKEFDEYNK
jgi:FKBP-type peptidyl-prolyl cis-trans isomerase 2